MWKTVMVSTLPSLLCDWPASVIIMPYEEVICMLKFNCSIITGCERRPWCHFIMFENSVEPLVPHILIVGNYRESPLTADMNLQIRAFSWERYFLSYWTSPTIHITAQTKGCIYVFSLKKNRCMPVLFNFIQEDIDLPSYLICLSQISVFIVC